VIFNTSYSFTILRKPESDNFRTKPFEYISCTYINHTFPTRFVFSRIFITLRSLLIFPQVPIMKKSMCIEKNVTVVALWYFFRKWLSQYVEIVKCVADCMIWFKFDKCIMPNFYAIATDKLPYFLNRN
jgi:hypothetical protein